MELEIAYVHNGSVEKAMDEYARKKNIPVSVNFTKMRNEYFYKNHWLHIVGWHHYHDGFLTVNLA